MVHVHKFKLVRFFGKTKTKQDLRYDIADFLRQMKFMHKRNAPRYIRIDQKYSKLCLR